MRQGRHEGLAEGALAEQAPEQVGNAESDVERVGQTGRAESRRHQQVAH
jgi:hypothetical protein